MSNEEDSREDTTRMLQEATDSLQSIESHCSQMLSDVASMHSDSQEREQHLECLSNAVDRQARTLEMLTRESTALKHEIMALLDNMYDVLTDAL